VNTGLNAGSQWTYFVEAVNAVGASAPTAGVNGTAGSGAASIPKTDYYTETFCGAV
jgi:hypothetical protein